MDPIYGYAPVIARTFVAGAAAVAVTEVARKIFGKETLALYLPYAEEISRIIVGGSSNALDSSLFESILLNEEM